MFLQNRHIPLQFHAPPSEIGARLGKHTDSTLRVAATDGGTAVIVAGDGAEILDDSPDWDGPFTEYDRAGRPTGHAYVRCPECGIGVLTGATDRASHRHTCRYASE